MGTPEFMAPEQISDPDAVDSRVDVYALGVIMYLMLAGKPPFTRDAAAVAAHADRRRAAAAHRARRDPRGLRAIVLKALAKNPANRFSSMREMGTELERFSSRTFSVGFLAGVVADAEEPAHSTSAPALPMQAAPDRSHRPSRRPPRPTRRPNRRAEGIRCLQRARRAGRRGAGLLVTGRRAEKPAPPQVVAPAPAPAPAAPSEPEATAAIHLAVESPTPQARVTLRRRTPLFRSRRI